MRILYASNAPLQPTGYGKIHREIVPRLNEDHEVVSYCVSGLQNTMPFMHNGVKTYGQSSQGGNLGTLDIPVVREMEDIDLVHLNFDAWAVSQIVAQYDFPWTLYPPVDHEPLPQNWIQVMSNASKNVPYCSFGKR